MRIYIIFLLLCSSLFAYKDSFYMGYFKSLQDGKVEKSSKFDIKNDDEASGFVLGWHNNTDSYQLAKTRYEFSYEKRDFELDKTTHSKGWKLGFAMSFGYNLDWLLTHEIVPFFKIGANVGEIREISRGSSVEMGVGIAYATRKLEFVLSADREFWQYSGMKFPFKTPFSNDGYIHNFKAGINYKF